MDIYTIGQFGHQESTPLPSIKEVPEKIDGDSFESPRKAIPLGEALESLQNEPPQKMIIPGVKQGSMGFIFGPPKSGKTTYCEYLLLSIAAGRNTFNGYPLHCDNRKCLMVSYEEDISSRAVRNTKQLNAFGEEEQALIKENYIVSSREMPKFVIGEEDWEALESEILYHKPGVVVADSLSKLTMDSNSDEEIAKGIAKRLRELVSKYDCTLIVINHTNKGGNERAYGIFSMSGSRIYMQEADFIIGINRSIDNTRYVKLVASRHANDDYDTVDTFKLDDNLCIEMTGQRNEASILASYDGRHDTTNVDTLYAEIQKIVEASGSNEFKTADIKHLYEDKTMAKATFFPALAELCESGRIKKLSNGKYQYVTT